MLVKQTWEGTRIWPEPNHLMDSQTARQPDTMEVPEAPVLADAHWAGQAGGEVVPSLSLAARCLREGRAWGVNHEGRK